MLNLTYKLTADDYLAHQLYIVSKSERIKKKRKRSQWLVPIFYTFIAGLFYIRLMLVYQSLGFLFFGILWYLFYPLYSKRRYRKHYQKHIKEHYSNKIGGIATLVFEQNVLLVLGEGTETKVNFSEIEEVIEIPHLFMIRVSTGDHLLVSKDTSVSLSDFKEQLKDDEVVFTDETDWEWR